MVGLFMSVGNRAVFRPVGVEDDPARRRLYKCHARLFRQEHTSIQSSYKEYANCRKSGRRQLVFLTGRGWEVYTVALFDSFTARILSP
jgi:hypothetical protein